MYNAISAKNSEMKAQLNNRQAILAGLFEQENRQGALFSWQRNMIRDLEWELQGLQEEHARIQFDRETQLVCARIWKSGQ